MEKTYSPQDIEQRAYARWEQGGHFAPSGQGPAYCIVIPPPNVTGTLHMGHAFQDTIMDALTRYHRMTGCDTLWQPGTDHAGIATQMVVERQLNAEGLTRHQLGREKFVERVWAWKEESGGTISRQLRRIGASVDWSRDRFTMDEGLSRAVIEAFVRLYDEGLIYRGKRLVNWDPVLKTALSDLEVLSEEVQGKKGQVSFKALGDGVTFLSQPLEKETRTVLHFHPEIAPITVAVFPLVKKDGMPEKAKELEKELRLARPELERAFLRWLDPANFDRQGRQRIRLSALTAPILKNRS